MSTSDAKHYMGEAPVGNVTKGRFRGNSTSDLSQYFGTHSANDEKFVGNGVFTKTDQDGNLEHYDANPWMKSMCQQIFEKLKGGKLTEAYNQLQGVMLLNLEHGLNLEDVLIDSLERSGLHDLAEYVIEKGGDEATVHAFAASPDGLASLAATLAQEELFSGSPRFVSEDHRAKESHTLRASVEAHTEKPEVKNAAPAFKPNYLGLAA